MMAVIEFMDKFYPYLYAMRQKMCDGDTDKEIHAFVMREIN